MVECVALRTLCYFIFFHRVLSTCARNKKLHSATEQDIIRCLLEEPKLSSGGARKYDYRIRPRGNDSLAINGGPVIVTINLYLRTISKVDDVNMEYSAHFTFREEWYDERLKFYSKTLPYINLSPGQDIWMPDTFFQNEKNGRVHHIDKPNVMIRIYNGTGHILYSTRLTLMLSCPMSLHSYPMDTQECFIELGSYAYTTNDIEYFWKSVKPIQIKAGLRRSMPSFRLSNVGVTTCSSLTNTGTYGCLRTVLTLKREFSYYLLQLYIPSFMLVAVSWVSFWLDKDSVPARVTLGVTTLLTMSTQASGVNAKLPPVSYTKAIDVWIGVCLAFIFGALLEFALVNYAARRDMLDDLRRRKKAESRNLLTYTEGPSFQYQARTSRQFSTARKKPSCRRPATNSPCRKAPKRSTALGALPTFWLQRYKERSKRIDVLARIIFPIAFACFNSIYWTTYLIPYLNVPVQDEE